MAVRNELNSKIWFLVNDELGGVHVDLVLNGFNDLTYILLLLLVVVLD